MTLFIISCFFIPKESIVIVAVNCPFTSTSNFTIYNISPNLFKLSIKISPKKVFLFTYLSFPSYIFIEKFGYSLVKFILNFFSLETGILENFLIIGYINSPSASFGSGFLVAIPNLYADISCKLKLILSFSSILADSKVAP